MAHEGPNDVDSPLPPPPFDGISGDKIPRLERPEGFDGEGVSVPPIKDEAPRGTAFELPEAQTDAADSVGDEPSQFQDPDNIDLDAANQVHGIYSTFVIGAIYRGADSFDKIMTATYLSQREDPSLEFIQNPIFPPDYHHGFIPYNNVLREAVNNSIVKGAIEQYVDDYELKIAESVTEQIIADCEETIRVHGAQLNRLYEIVKNTLDVYRGEDLIEKMKKVNEMDQILAKSSLFGRLNSSE